MLRLSEAGIRGIPQGTPLGRPVSSLQVPGLLNRPKENVGRDFKTKTFSSVQLHRVGEKIPSILSCLTKNSVTSSQCIVGMLLDTRQ